MKELSFMERIAAKEPKLTNLEKKIVAYLRNAQEGVLNDTITDFAEKAGVSDATVVRFCKHLGYKGYQDFKIHVARDVLPRENQYNPALQKYDDAATIRDKIFNSDISVLGRTRLNLEIETLQEAARRIRKANRVVLLGTGGSLNVAKDALHKFMKVGIMLYVYEDVDLQRMAVSLLQEEDLVMAISYSGSNLNVLRCVELAKERDVFTIALTGYSRNPISKAADLSLQVTSEETMFHSESAGTRMAQLAVIDVLVALAAFHDYDKSYEAIQATRLATSDNKF